MRSKSSCCISDEAVLVSASGKEEKHKQQLITMGRSKERETLAISSKCIIEIE